MISLSKFEKQTENNAKMILENMMALMSSKLTLR